MSTLQQTSPEQSESLNALIRENSEKVPDALPFQSGGIRSHSAPRFDLIPPIFLIVLADRLALGLRKKKEREILQRYKRATEEEKLAILEDEAWWTEMKNHLQEHLLDMVHERFEFDSLFGHCGAIMWNAGMFAWRESELRKRGKTSTPGISTAETATQVRATDCGGNGAPAKPDAGN